MTRRHLPRTLALSLTLFLLALALLSAGEGLGEPLPPSGLAPDEIMRLGEAMYRDGILPSGKPLPALIRGDVEVDSSAFSCSSCHLRAGLGSFEGGVVTPPTTGLKLYRPYRRPPSLHDSQDKAGRFIYAKTTVQRPAYDRDTLATALRFGVDPARQIFNDVMPRYPLGDRDMAILIDYLEALSARPSPGASSGTMAFATIVTDDVGPKERQALLTPLQDFIARSNQQLALYQDFIKFGYTPTVEMRDAFRAASLDVWELKGAPEGWPAQLESYYRRKPVFAVLGGISNGDWRPIHEFCEARRLPCLFPITDLPVVSDTSWYTYYFNKGYYQEGEALARYLNRLDGLPEPGSMLQIVQDAPRGRALAAGFERAWGDCGRSRPATVTLSAEELAAPGRLERLLAQRAPKLLLLWVDGQVVAGLPALAGKLPPAARIFLSSSYLGQKSAQLPEPVRDRVYLTFPYRLTPYLGPRDGGFDAKVPILTGAKEFGERRITSRTVSMLQQAVLRGLNLLYDNLQRDHLLDVMSMQMDLTLRDYERLSFGPGQRYVSKGCYIIQLGPGADPPLLPRSEWVTH